MTYSSAYGTEGCPRNRLKMRRFLVFLYPEEAELVPSWSQKSLGMEGTRQKAPKEAVGCITASGGGSTTQILNLRRT